MSSLFHFRQCNTTTSERCKTVQNGAKFYAQKDFFSMIVAFLSSELHREISIQAAQERITLNQYVLKALEQSLLPV